MRWLTGWWSVAGCAMWPLWAVSPPTKRRSSTTPPTDVRAHGASPHHSPSMFIASPHPPPHTRAVRAPPRDAGPGPSAHAQRDPYDAPPARRQRVLVEDNSEADEADDGPLEAENTVTADRRRLFTIRRLPSIARGTCPSTRVPPPCPMGFSHTVVGVACGQWDERAGVRPGRPCRACAVFFEVASPVSD